MNSSGRSLRQGKAVEELRFPRSFVFARMTEDRYGAKHNLVLASAGKTYPIAIGLGVGERGRAGRHAQQDAAPRRARFRQAPEAAAGARISLPMIRLSAPRRINDRYAVGNSRARMSSGDRPSMAMISERSELPCATTMTV